MIHGDTQEMLVLFSFEGNCSFIKKILSFDTNAFMPFI